MLKTEPLSGGLVTVRDPSVLGEGELQEATNICYKPNSPSAWVIPGRALVLDTAVDVTGAAYCGFDTTNDQVVLQTAAAYYALDPELRSLTSLGAITGGSQLTSIQFEDKHYLLNGVANKVLKNDLTLRQHGMAPVTSVVGLTLVQDGTGSWATGAAPVPNTYEYWVTEVYKSADGSEVIEGDYQYDGLLPAVTVVNSTDWVKIALPPVVNTAVNGTLLYRRVYRGVSRSNAYLNSFPFGTLVADVPATVTEVIDGKPTVLPGGVGTYAFPTTEANVTPQVNTFQVWYNGVFQPLTQTAFADTAADVWDTIWGSGTWSNLANVTASDNTYATTALTAYLIEDGGPVLGSKATAVLGGFGFGAATPPISSVKVRVEAKYSTSATGVAPRLTATLVTVVGGITYIGPSQSVPISTTEAAPVVGDLNWGVSYLSTILSAADGSFYVYLTADANYTTPGVTYTISVDAVDVQLSYAGSYSSDIEFPKIELPGGAAIGANGQPPEATTGDIFQDCLVTNDVQVPNAIAWSKPGEPEAFPTVYRMAFNTASKDRVTNLKTLSNWLMVGLSGQLWRVNLLPQGTDADLNSGRARDLVDPNYGVVGPRAACLFVAGQQLQMAYVCATHIRYTNGYSAESLVNSINLLDYADPSLLSTAELVNDPSTYELLLFYTDYDGVRKQLRFSYHASHLSNGLKVTGPCDVPGAYIAGGYNSNGVPVLFSVMGQNVYRENTGDWDESGNVTIARVNTREIFLFGAGREWTYDELNVHYSGGTAPGTFTAWLNMIKTNQPVARSSSSRQRTHGTRGFLQLQYREQSEGIETTLEIDLSYKQRVALDYLVINGTTLGEADSFR